MGFMLDVYMYILYVLTVAFVGWILYTAYTECTGARPAAAGDYEQERQSEQNCVRHIHLHYITS